MKRLLSLILLLCLLHASALADIAAEANQKIATRSGPGTKYTEELGTLPMNTKLTVIEMVTTDGTPWCMFEYSNNGKLYRAYTGLKRLNVFSGSIPEGSLSYTDDTVIAAGKGYYGPGTQYAQRKETLSKGMTVRVYSVTGEYALCDYKPSGSKWVRAYVPTAWLQNTQAETIVSGTAGGLGRAGNIIGKNLCLDYYGEEFNYAGYSDDYAALVGLLPCLDRESISGISVIRHSDVYSGPGEWYWRGMKGNAHTGVLDTDITVYGKEKGWILITYPSDYNQGFRLGFTKPSALSQKDLSRVQKLTLAYEPVLVTRLCSLTDDPFYSLEKVTDLSAGSELTALAFLDAERSWIYVECQVYLGLNLVTMRGFVSADCLKLK